MFSDLRYAFRSLLRTPGFTLVAVFTLALGIGATTAVFTVINAFWFKPLPVPEASRLVIPYMTTAISQFPDFFSVPEYRDLQKQKETFTAVMGHTGIPLSWSRSGKPQLIWGELVSDNYFSGLGLKPHLGRTFLPEENQASGSHPVAVLSYHFWQSRLSADPNVVGTALKLNGKALTVVGVAPKGFVGTRLLGYIPDLWMPFMMYSELVPGSADTRARLEKRDYRWMRLIARLQPGVSKAQAQTRMAAIASQLEHDYPESNKGTRMGVVSGATRTEAFLEVMGLKLTGSGLLFGTGLLVLLVACSNVANLLLARASTRTKEMAMRQALGAGKARLIRLLLMESVTLSLFGAGLGILLAAFMTDALNLTKPSLDFNFGFDLGIDWRVLAFAVGAAVTTGVLFGLAPALRSSRPELIEALKAGESVGLRGGGHWSLRQALIVSQVALSLVALIVAGLFIRSAVKAQQMDLGFQKQNLLVASVDLGLQGYNETQGRQFYRQLIDRLEAIPGVQGAAVGYPLPLDDETQGARIYVEGFVARQATDKLIVLRGIVGKNYFSTMKTALVAGRDFTEQDDESKPRVAVINESFARRFWSGRDAVGQRFRLGDADGPWVQVIGVAKDGKYLTVGESPQAYVFLPLAQNYSRKVRMVLRSSGDPRGLAESVRQAVGQLDGDLPVFGVKTMDEFLDRLLSVPKAAAAIVGLFGFLALLMAAVGLYGLLSFAVHRRTREIGIRMALGAQRRDVVGLVVRQGLVLVGIGVVAGVGLALAATRLVTTLLYDVSASDPLTYALFSLLLAVVAVGACLLPARRATRVDPMVALRYE